MVSFYSIFNHQIAMGTNFSGFIDQLIDTSFLVIFGVIITS